MPTKEEVFTGVRDALIEALASDEEDVTMEATLVDDLGAESIDLLDIVFQLEKKFSIKIDRSELIPEDLLNDAQFVVDGKLTANGLEELKRRMPDKDLSDFARNPMVQNISKILTVADMCTLVENKLA